MDCPTHEIRWHWWSVCEGRQQVAWLANEEKNTFLVFCSFLNNPRALSGLSRHTFLESFPKQYSQSPFHLYNVLCVVDSWPSCRARRNTGKLCVRKSKKIA